jgi:hypothetical protein
MHRRDHVPRRRQFVVGVVAHNNFVHCHRDTTLDIEALNRVRALDARRRTRDEGEEHREDVVEIHNHIPMSAEPDNDRARDNEERAEEPDEGEEVGRFPANQFHFVTDGDDVVIYKGAGTPKHKTDIFDVNDMSARDSRSRPPQTLRELNAFNAAHYRQKAGRR